MVPPDWFGLLPPNGSRLSCGASADGRKHPALRYELVGVQTYASSESRPRQLQALVKPRPVKSQRVDDWCERVDRRQGKSREIVRHHEIICAAPDVDHERPPTTAPR